MHACNTVDFFRDRNITCAQIHGDEEVASYGVSIPQLATVIPVVEDPEVMEPVVMDPEVLAVIDIPEMVDLEVLEIPEGPVVIPAGPVVIPAEVGPEVILRVQSAGSSRRGRRLRFLAGLVAAAAVGVVGGMVIHDHTRKQGNIDSTGVFLILYEWQE
jgi:hypothetical protein